MDDSQQTTQQPIPQSPVDTSLINNDEKFPQEEELLQKLDTGAQVAKQEIMAKNPEDTMALLTVDVERDLLYHIIINLKNNNISYQQAQELARQFLALLPLQDKQDLLKKLQTIRKKNPGLGVNNVYLKYSMPYEEEQTQNKLDMMRQHLQSGNIEQAISVAKGETPNV
jgi:hypothetical protein